MAGYKNKNKRLDFPELSEKGDAIYVVIKNPKLVTADEFDTGLPDDADAEAQKEAQAKLIAGMVRDWHVYDANDDSEDPQPFPVPAEPWMVRALPLEIVKKINMTFAETLNPQ